MRKKIHLIILCIMFISSCRSHAGETVVSFAGDIIMHIPVKRSVINYNVTDPATKKSTNNEGFDYLFDRIKSSFSDSHITVGNMEFPVSPPFESRPKIFNCRPEVIPALRRANFNMLHLGNNHILDQGATGIVSTIKYLKSYGMDYVGVDTDEASARSGRVIPVNGIRIGFIGYTGILNYQMPAKQNGFYINWLYRRDRVTDDIINIKKRCDYLVMIIHYGVEYDLLPQEKDRALLKKYINSGVDLVIGHHPHLIQPVEKVVTNDGRENYIFYSLGNFISNQSGRSESGKESYPGTRDSIIVKARLTRDKNIIRQKFDVIPIITRNEYNPSTKKHEIQTAPLVEEMDILKKKYSTDKNQAYPAKIKILEKRYSGIENALFKYGRYESVQLFK